MQMKFLCVIRYLKHKVLTHINLGIKERAKAEAIDGDRVLVAEQQETHSPETVRWKSLS